jgi:hypothetical protein
MGSVFWPIRFLLPVCQELIDKHVPSKMTSVRYSQAWINTEIKRLSRRKQYTYNKAKASKKTKDWDHYKSIKKKCQIQCSPKAFLTTRHLGQWLAKVTRPNQCTLDQRYFYFPAPVLSLNCFSQYHMYYTSFVHVRRSVTKGDRWSSGA